MDGLATLDSVQQDARVSESGQDLHAIQHTLRNAISCRGVGLHSGRIMTLRLLPAPAGHGIVFRRCDLGIDIPARFDHVVDTRLSTVIASSTDARARVATTEHVMAALAGCRIDNVLIEVDGPEVPALDGSAAQFVFLIDCAGRAAQDAPRGAIEVLRRVRVQEGEAFAELRPAPSASFNLALSIAFRARVIGRQAYSMILTEDDFRRELSVCRTFAMLDEIESLREAGLARGGSLDNAIVVDDDRVLNPAGLRRSDEFVRHKMLDAIGDLALAGAPIRGSFVGHRSGHGLNNRLLRKLLADPANWRHDTGNAAADEGLLAA
ncbi:UDP-3-O-acyl-N-acetylglucosamine deacetylase [Lichenicoccus sp.]|uniref:UDP-3-O-acyl-N-acetylglucosamine deacetylase n=1 Tax=Lichenicoccus sp. TaxID=2781899 RepID=UPI003D152A78